MGTVRSILESASRSLIAEGEVAVGGESVTVDKGLARHPRPIRARWSQRSPQGSESRLESAHGALRATVQGAE